MENKMVCRGSKKRKKRHFLTELALWPEFHDRSDGGWEQVIVSGKARSPWRTLTITGPVKQAITEQGKLRCTVPNEAKEARDSGVQCSSDKHHEVLPLLSSSPWRQRPVGGYLVHTAVGIQEEGRHVGRHRQGHKTMLFLGK